MTPGPPETRQSVEDWLRHRIGGLLQRSASQVDVHRRFVELGVESIEATTMSVELEDLLGVSLPLTLLWDHPTIASLAAHLETLRAARMPSERPSSETYDVTTIPEEHWRFERTAGYRALAERLGALRAGNIESPFFHEHDGMLRSATRMGGRELVSFNGFNYLGLLGHPEVNEAAVEAVRRYGTSVAASPVVGGKRSVHGALEQELAAFLGVDDALLFVSGFGVNVSTIAALMGPRDLVVHDQYAHASVLQGAALAGARILPFKHNDCAHLDELLRRRRGQHEKVLVAVEGLYSADGDVCPLRELVEIKRRHRAWLYVDDAHGFGTLGQHGRGTIEHAGVAPGDVDVIMLTISKSLASTGGAIAGSRAVVEYLRYTAFGFINATGLSPASAAAALAALRLMQREPERVARLQRLSAHFDEKARAAGLDVGTSLPHVPTKPVLVGDDVRCFEVSNRLLARGLDVHPMVHPTVPAGAARLRFFVTADHTEEQIDRAITLTAEEFR